MAIVLPSNWVSTQAYAVGAQVSYNGIGYECLTAVAANASGNAIPVGNSSWQVYAVFRITEYYSLQEAILQAVNSDDDFIESSLPLFIQNAERKIGKLLRSPAQVVTRTYSVDSQSRFAIPLDLLEIIHLRWDNDDGGYDLQSRGSISMQRMDRTNFEELKQYYSDTTYNYEYGSYEYPGYRTDNRYVHIAPDYAAGEMFEMMYYQEVPELGSTVGITNSTGTPLNSAGQTQAQWVAAGNSASTFVQETELVLNNLWTATTPHLLKAAACKEAEDYLGNSERAAVWDAQFKELLIATETEFRKFDSGGSQHITQSTAY